MADAGGITLDTIVTSLGNNLGTFEAKISAALADQDVTATDLIALQKTAAEYTLFLNTHSTIMKTFTDELKEIMRKVG
ncbi:MAG TPA: EscF/YscF/HrpA family type III secretion system needle major subunit [Geminicoccaceae bacterium]|nr:EscF/YscF/HrpA family type III secretion system needle major subunit [Geminicoccaceae bacterium]